MKAKVRLATTSKYSRLASNRVLAQVRAERPTQVVVWYQSENGRTGVIISDGTERVKAVGALTAAAHDVWSE